MTNDILNIETRTKIAADAALTIQQYLNDLNQSLVANGIDNSYSIVSDTEEIIIDVLNGVGSPTKLGTDVVMDLIHKEIGTVETFVAQYTSDKMAYETKDGIQLVKRRRLTNQSPKTALQHVTSPIVSLILKTAVLSTPALLFIGFLFALMNPNHFFDNLVYARLEPTIYFVIIATVLFIGQEVYSGITGKLILEKESNRKLRTFHRGLLSTHLLFAVLTNYLVLREVNHYLAHSSTDWDSYLSNIFLFDLLADSVDLLSIIFSIFVVTECVVLLRDHLPNLYPLEPEFKHSIRFLTPSYILIEISLFILFITYYQSIEELEWIVMVTSTVAFYWIWLRNIKVSSRVYVMIFTIQMLAIQFDIDMIYFINLYWPYLGVKLFQAIFMMQRPKIIPSSIKQRYLDYYESQRRE
ncbi:MAG: hypothetical protein INQ03_20560 [Candidatus Heimdallarchaeota archaeon]|nr:hypothetical protein [Candidatus Heimdallarchaeota archaeon]